MKHVCIHYKKNKYLKILVLGTYELEINYLSKSILTVVFKYICANDQITRKKPSNFNTFFIDDLSTMCINKRKDKIQEPFIILLIKIYKTLKSINKMRRIL